MLFDRRKLVVAQCASGLTGAEISARAGIPQAQYSTVVKRGSCQPKTLAAIAHALEIDVSELIKED